MPLPTQRPVTGLYTNPITGAPATGTVTFAPYPDTWTDAVGNQVMSGHQTVTLVNGAFTQNLVPTATPGVYPTAGKLWRITEQLTGQPKKVWFFELPVSGDPIDITDLVELDPEPPPFLPVGTAGGDLAGSYPSPTLRNSPTARTNLGLGTAATRDVGTAAGQVAAGDDSRIAGALQKSSNLSDLVDAASARTNLGLANSATRPVGQTSGTVAAGDDPRFSTGGGGGSTIRTARARIVDGTITDVPSAPSWAVVQTSAGTPLQCAVPAAIGDRIRICGNFMYSGTRFLDWAVLNSAGALAAYYLTTETSTPGAEGNPVMYPSNSFGKMNGTEIFTVTAPMLNGSNQVVVALANQGTGIGVVYAHSTYPWKLRLENIGPEPA